jgi:hypothetical protein
MIHYYDNKNNIYTNHIDAIKSGNISYLYYHDDFFMQQNWQTRSIFSLEQLYRMRAEELREKYEYVVLCLSGGIDSRNVFESFYNNDLLIDQIISVGAFSQDSFKGSDENNNKEIYVNVDDLLKRVSLPNTKVSLIDYTEMFQDINQLSLISDYGNEWFRHIGYWKSVIQIFFRDIHKHINSGSKKTCVIFGSGKTSVNYDSLISKHYFNFSEIELIDYGNIYSKENITRENFYWGNSPTCVEIIKKQAESLIDFKRLLNNDATFNYNYNRIFNRLIYKTVQRPLVIPTRKSTNSYLSIRDQYMKRKQNSDIFSIYADGIKKLNQEIGLSYRPHLSRPYYFNF